MGSGRALPDGWCVIRSRVQFNHIFVVQHVVSFDLRAVVNFAAPNAGEFQVLGEVFVNELGHFVQRGPAVDRVGLGVVRLLGLRELRIGRG